MECWLRLVTKKTGDWLLQYFSLNCPKRNILVILGGSPGLVVMGGDSRSEGSGFESQCRILDGHFKNKIIFFQDLTSRRAWSLTSPETTEAQTFSSPKRFNIILTLGCGGGDDGRVVTMLAFCSDVPSLNPAES